MKVKIKITGQEWDALFIKILRESAKTCRDVCRDSKHPNDKQYAADYLDAANFVLEHFGGKPVKK